MKISEFHGTMTAQYGKERSVYEWLQSLKGGRRSTVGARVLGGHRQVGIERQLSMTITVLSRQNFMTGCKHLKEGGRVSLMMCVLGGHRL